MSLNRKMLVAFDLDDTLYSEIHYWQSGVARVLDQIHDLGLARKNARYSYGSPTGPINDIFERIISYYGLPSTMLSSLVWAYRIHVPEIKLTDGAQTVLDWCQVQGHEVVIITDGRSITQRLKIRALGLERFKCFISEESGQEKPSTYSFLASAVGFEPSLSVYIGDNVAKDFIAPNTLGWKTIGLVNSGENIRPTTTPSLVSHGSLPQYWIERLVDVITVLRCVK